MNVLAHTFRSIRPTRRMVASGSLALAALVAGAGPVLGHENEVVRVGSFFGGMTHPVLGVDHLLAMLSVGIISTQHGGRSILTVPATFVLFMAIGGTIGLIGQVAVGGLVELGIGASVLFLGVVIASGRRLPLAVTYAAVAAFGSVHGYAHGLETPTIAEPTQYVLGFLVGTALIHLTGVLVGEVARQYGPGPRLLRLSGVAIALAGGLFVVGIL